MQKQITLYVKPDCSLCDRALEVLQTATTAVAGKSKIQTRDITTDPALLKIFGDHIPVADFGSNVRLYWPFSVEDVQVVMKKEVGASSPAPPISPVPAKGITRTLVIILNKYVALFTRYWLPALGIIVAIYALLPLLAPILMAAGYEWPANLIYTVYRLSCHQLPSRSFFVFGYQVAFCERCQAIYMALLASVPVFFFLRRHLKPLPLWAYAFFVAPMAVDGISQILGMRASTWHLRVVTGALFGIGSAWLALPYLEQGFEDAQDTAQDNLDRAEAD